MILTILALTASLIIIGTYAHLARTGKPTAFHWANALGCVPIIVQNSLAHVWAALILTVFFGLVGWYGLIMAWADNKTQAAVREANSYWKHVASVERKVVDVAIHRHHP